MCVRDRFMLKLISRWMTVNNGSKRSAQLRQLAAQQNTFRHTMPVYRHHAPKRIRSKKKVLLLAPQQCLHARTTKSKNSFSEREQTNVAAQWQSFYTYVFISRGFYQAVARPVPMPTRAPERGRSASFSSSAGEGGGQGRVSEVGTAQGVNSSLILLPLSFF
jgi:hypothetical protein